MSRQYRFTKMHGCGNDFFLFDCFGQSLFDPETMALILSDRHVGIGGDGMVMLCPSEKADLRLRFFDTDGTETPLCGNGLRCAVKLAIEHGLIEKNDVTVETPAGILSAVYLPQTRSRNGKNADVRVDFGVPVITPEVFGLSSAHCVDSALGVTVSLGGQERILNAVQVGNSFCILFGEENKLTDPTGEAFDIDRFAFVPFAETCMKDTAYPTGSDLCVVKVLDKTTLAIRTYENRNGETRACGTGACAAVAAACLRGLCARDKDITVRLRGGEMTVCYKSDGQGGHILLTGSASTVYNGEILF